MKQITLLLIFFYLVSNSYGQTTGRINDLIDAWGEHYDYIGDIKNKQPNGLGA